MSFRPLTEILRTSHFRTAASFLVLFGLAGAGLLGYVYWQTSVYLSSEVDRSLATTAERWSRMSPDDVLREITSRALRDPERRQPAALLNASGQRVAGTLALTSPIARYGRPFRATQLTGDGVISPMRAVARRLASGRVLVVAQDVHDLEEFDALIGRAMAGGAVVIVLSGLGGAILLGRSAKHRLDAMTSSLRQIVDGNLGVRLPTRGRTDDMDRIAAMVNTMLDEIERLMGEVKGVTDDIAHDLRTPLTRMLAALDRARDAKPGSVPWKTTLDDASHDARLLLRMFKGLLRISEVENGARRQAFEPVDLLVVLKDAVELYEPLAQERRIGLAMESDQARCVISGDADLLFDAACNLVDNALKFTPPEGRVQVALQVDGGRCSVRVTDTGPGIPLDEREAVLRRFYRTERSRHEPGHGLGLSLVAAVARLHGMTLTIDDAAPGCCVSLTQASSAPAPAEGTGPRPRQAHHHL